MAYSRRDRQERKITDEIETRWPEVEFVSIDFLEEDDQKLKDNEMESYKDMIEKQAEIIEDLKEALFRETVETIELEEQIAIYEAAEMVEFEKYKEARPKSERELRLKKMKELIDKKEEIQ